MRYYRASLQSPLSCRTVHQHSCRAVVASGRRIWNMTTTFGTTLALSASACRPPSQWLSFGLGHAISSLSFCHTWCIYMVTECRHSLHVLPIVPPSPPPFTERISRYYRRNSANINDVGDLISCLLCPYGISVAIEDNQSAAEHNPINALIFDEGKDEAVTCVVEALFSHFTCTFIYSNVFNSSHFDDFDTFLSKNVQPLVNRESRLTQIFYDILRGSLQFFV